MGSNFQEAKVEESSINRCDITEIREAAKETPELSPLYVPLIEVQKWFGISRDTIYRAKKKGTIKIYKAGNRSILRVAEVHRWIEHCSNVP